MRVQKIYENALALIGRTEEGTDYSFMDRVTSLLNPDIAVLNAFRGDDNLIPEVEKISDDIDITAKEAQGLSLCLACMAASEIDGFSESRLSLLYRQRGTVMGSINTGMEDITETIGME